MLDLLKVSTCSLLFSISAVAGFRPTTTGAPGKHSLIKSDIILPRYYPSSFSLQSQSDDASEPASSSSPSSFGASVRLLGRGANAIVRPGVVLVAPPDEFHHFLRKSAVFIYAMGTDDDDVYVIRGAIIDHPTPFTIHEMTPGGAAVLNGEETEKPSTPETECLQNLVYRGGERGDSVFMLHSDAKLADQVDQEMIGSTGVFQGGLDHALTTNYVLDPLKAKFFFSYMEFTEAELDEMLGNREDENTQWVSVEVPPDFVLNNTWDRGEAWARLRNAIRER
jgi:hypothetical protein